MPGNRPCAAGCICEKHSRDKTHIQRLGAGRKPCPRGCSCARHDRDARRAAAGSRWDKATPEDRAAQAEVMRRALRLRWAEYDNRRVSKERMLRPQDYSTYRDERVWPEGDVLEIAKQLDVSAPSKPTLRKYGLTDFEWLEILASQGWACAICHRRSRGLVVDHEHVPNWKKQEPGERKRFVRGILCPYDNYRIVPSRLTAEEAKRMATYLTRYEKARDVLKPRKRRAA